MILKEICTCANIRTSTGVEQRTKYFIVPKSKYILLVKIGWIRITFHHIYIKYTSLESCVPIYLAKRWYRDLNGFNHSEFDELFNRIGSGSVIFVVRAIINPLGNFSFPTKERTEGKMALDLRHTCFSPQQRDPSAFYSWTNFQLASAWVPSRRPALSFSLDSDKGPGGTILGAAI